MQGDIVAQGVELMLYGMGTVVLFLVLLVVVTMMMSHLISRYFPESEPSNAAAGHNVRGQAQTAHDPNLVAVISAAIHRHRVDKK